MLWIFRVCAPGKRALTLAALLSLAAVCARPQAISHVAGQVISDDAPLQHDLTVELIGGQSQQPIARAAVSFNGEFEIGEIPPGNYELRVLDGAQRVIQSQFVHLGSTSEMVSVRLPEVKQERPPSGTVSVARLQHKIPPKAFKEFKKAGEASEAGEMQKSIDHLKKAIEIDPDFAEAYNNLGVRYLKLNQMELAAEQFRKAVELDDSSPPVFCNLSVALYNLDRLPEAEQAARSAVRLNGANPRPRMMLGLIVKAAPGREEEALENLRAAQQEFPKMRLAVAEILFRQGERRQAADELRRYLESGKAEDREQVETWIAQLEQEQSSRVGR